MENRDRYFQNQRLFLDESEIDLITKASVCIVGLGGIGGYVAEGLARNGFRDFKITDHDSYELQNMRQLHMTSQTVGEAKVDVVSSRIRDITPDCSIQAFPNGINANNARELCHGSNLIVQEADTLAASCIAHYWGSKLRIPVVHGSRVSLERSGMMTVDIADYRICGTCFHLDTEHFSKAWGVSERLLEVFFQTIIEEKDSSELDTFIQNENILYRKARVSQLAHSGGDRELEHFMLGKNRAHLKEIMKEYPDEFFKLRITPEQVMCMGAMVVYSVKNLIIERQFKVPFIGFE